MYNPPSFANLNQSEKCSNQSENEKRARGKAKARGGHSLCSAPCPLAPACAVALDPRLSFCLVLDSAPAHSQTETRVKKHADMVTLRLAPYSPMCNPIEGCFSVLKAKVKDLLAMYREELASPPQLLEDGVAVTMLEWRMRMLEDFASRAVASITPKLVASMELHARDAVNAAIRMEDMQYGH